MDVRMTVCTSIGAKSYFYITQTRRVGAVVNSEARGESTPPR